MSLESQFSAIKKGGFKVDNISHLDSGMWFCSIRRVKDKPDVFKAFGPDLESAISDVLSLAREGKTSKSTYVPPVLAKHEHSEPSVLDSLFEDD